MAKPQVKNINVKDYYDEFYKDYGGVKGVFEKRLLADPSLNLATEPSDYPQQVMEYRGNQQLPATNYRNTILENPRKTVKVVNDPNYNDIGTGDYDANTETIRIKAEKNTPKSDMIQHHEMAHNVQDINGRAAIGKNTYFSLINQIDSEKGRLAVPYDMRRDEIDGQIAQIARGYKNATNKVIITEQDAEDAWKYLVDEGNSKGIPAYFNRIGLTKEHFKKLSRKIAYNKNKTLEDPNYA